MDQYFAIDNLTFLPVGTPAPESFGIEVDIARTCTRPVILCHFLCTMQRMISTDIVRFNSKPAGLRMCCICLRCAEVDTPMYIPSDSGTDNADMCYRCVEAAFGSGLLFKDPHTIMATFTLLVLFSAAFLSHQVR